MTRWNKLPSRTMSISKYKLLETRKRLSNESTTEPRAFMVVRILNYSEQALTETYSFYNEIGV